MPMQASFPQQIGSGGLKLCEVNERKREAEGGRFFSLSPAFSFFTLPECFFEDIIPQRHRLLRLKITNLPNAFDLTWV